jgi:UDP-glucose 4-epimerase
MKKEIKFLGLNVLVTGGAGFIGSHLVEALLSYQANVTVLDCMNDNLMNNLGKRVSEIKFVNLNILSPDAKELIALNKFDIIYHLANNANVRSSIDNPSSDLEKNLLSTFYLLETIRVKSPDTCLVYLSSAAVYGNPRFIPIDESTPLAPISPYGVSKLAAERYVSVYRDLYGLKTVILRPFSVYGPRQTKLVIFDLINKLYKNPWELHLHGDGSQIRDFCYVDDAVRAILLVTLRGTLTGEVYNLASAQGISIAKLTELVSETMGIKPIVIFSGSNRQGDPQEWVADIGRLNRIGYCPQINLSEGIQRTYQWFKRCIIT